MSSKTQNEIGRDVITREERDYNAVHPSCILGRINPVDQGEVGTARPTDVTAQRVTTGARKHHWE